MKTGRRRDSENQLLFEFTAEDQEARKRKHQLWLKRSAPRLFLYRKHQERMGRLTKSSAL